MGLWQSFVSHCDQLWQYAAEEPELFGKLFALVVLVADLIRRRCKFNWPDQAVKSGITNLALIVVNGLFAPCILFLTIWAQSTYNIFGIPHLDSSRWENVPNWLLVIVTLLAFDFCDYWVHRFLHNQKWLWPIHAIHHSDPHVTVLTTGRIHFLEAVVMRIAYIFLLSWMGLPGQVLGGGVALQLVHNMYVHINVDWTHGPLRYIIASPRYHRWHHANTPEAHGMNLANIFPIYDILFGTYYVPGACKEDVGADGIPVNNVCQLVTWPFTEWIYSGVRRFQKLRKYLIAGNRHTTPSA